MADDSLPEIPICPDCGQPLEVLLACGARDYFCNNCNELKSRTRVREANEAFFAVQHKENP